MRVKIVADSSANLENVKGVDFSSVPLKIITSEKEYTDDYNLCIPDMMDELSKYDGTSSTSCPGIGDWIDAFSDADVVLAASLTSKLSGCYNSARAAADTYTEDNPDKKVFVLDSLSTGPELELIVEKYAELVNNDMAYEDVCDSIKEYSKKTHLAFSLESLSNFVKNGRVSATVAKLAGLLNIRIVGRASNEGELEPLNKCRGRVKAVEQVYKNMRDEGYNGGKVRIRHTDNISAANQLEKIILDEFSDADITIGDNKGICSYYTECGGLLVGFES